LFRLLFLGAQYLSIIIIIINKSIVGMMDLGNPRIFVTYIKVLSMILAGVKLVVVTISV
jgi:hypothetical protein